MKICNYNVEALNSGQNRNFGQKLEFRPNLGISSKNLNFDRNLEFRPKIGILIEHFVMIESFNFG